MDHLFTNVTVYRFGPFTLDTRRRVLCYENGVRSIPEKPFQILLLLLQANGRLVSKDDFSLRVWGDACVSDANLAQQILMLRKLLGEYDSGATYILSVSGQGYRFAQPSSVVMATREAGASAPAVPFDSFTLYCKASHFLEKRTKRDLEASLGLFNQSLDRDPTSGATWFGLSRAYALLGEYAYASPSEAFPKARDAIEQGLANDSTSSAGRALLSEIQMFGDWDFDAAERSLSQALALSPQSTFARHNLAWFYLCSGAFDNAIVVARQALVSDPTSMAFLLILGRALMLRGDTSEAISCFANALEVEPGNYWARLMRAIAYILTGTPEQAIDDLTSVERQGPELPLLARAFANLGDLQRARGVFAQLELLARAQYVSNWDFALALAAIGRHDEAFANLARAFETREPLPLLLPGLSNLFGALVTEARFKALVARVSRNSRRSRA